MNYTWKIESVDDATRTMVVKYTLDGEDTLLNVPKPAVTDDLAEHVVKFAPIHAWRKALEDDFEITVGTEGTASFEPVTPTPAPAPETAAVIGNVNEEYLRALIFQVLEELNESQAPAPAP